MSLSRKLWYIINEESIFRDLMDMKQYLEFTDYVGKGATPFSINSKDYKVVQKGKKIYLIKLVTASGKQVFNDDKELEDYIKKFTPEYLLKGLEKYDNDIIGSLEMSPCMPGAMIKQGSEYLFNTLGWPDQPTSLPGHDESSYRPI